MAFKDNMKHRIPGDVLFSNISFFDSYRMSFRGERGTVYKCDKVNQRVILSYGNTVMLQMGPQYAPEIRHAAVFVTDRVIKPPVELYELFKICRINRGLM